MLTVDTLSFEAFRRLGKAWNDLLLATERPLPFLTHQWICRWWERFGVGQDFVALVVRDRDRLIAGLPIAVADRRFVGLAVKVAEIVGTGPLATRGMGLADKADLLVRKDAPAEARDRLVRKMVELLDDVDLLDVKGCDSASQTVPGLASYAPDSRSRREIERSTSPYLELPGSWEEYLAVRSRKFRKNLRRYRRNLERSGKIEVARMERGADVAAWLSEIISVNERSWKAERGTNFFRSPDLREFMLELIPDLVEEDWVGLHVLRLDGQAIAYELAFDLGGRIFAYNASYDTAWQQYSPGTLMTAAVIEWACEQGRTEYDMLRGDHGYKMHWSETFRTELQLLIPGPGLKSALYATFGPYLKSRLKRMRWLGELDDRLSGAIGRLRYRGSK